jgi:hypothetical protein
MAFIVHVSHNKDGAVVPAPRLIGREGVKEYFFRNHTVASKNIPYLAGHLVIPNIDVYLFGFQELMDELCIGLGNGLVF